MKRLISLLIIGSISGFAIADEGMWTMDQIDKLDLEKKGLKIPLDEVYNSDGNSLFDAIVRLGGGTSEFVWKHQGGSCVRYCVSESSGHGEIYSGD